jgi:zinc protease
MIRALALASLFVASVAQAKAPVKVTTVEGITECRLDNGLKVLLYPDTSKATLTVNITYFVGSRHEGYGETGMAHLLEHMMFKGTPSHPDIWKLMQDHGAGSKFNGTTFLDRTNYYEELPASPENLEFALSLEADRMLNSKIAAEDLAKEFTVVRNEFEMNENNPPNVLEEKMFASAYQWHNYGKSTIGSRSDIERVPIENLRAFYRQHYQPDNAMLLVAGKFDEPKTLALVQKYFDSLPRPARKLATTWTEEPVQDGERSVVLRRTGDIAVVSLMYHGAAGADPQWLGEDALTDVLSNKPAGRLYKALVDKGLASEVYGYVYPTAEPGVLVLGAKVPKGGSPDKVRETMIKVVEGIGASGVTPAEVDRWRARTLKEFELMLADTAQVGVVLSDWAAMGDWRLFFLARDRARTVTPAAVQQVAQAYLKESNRTVGTFLPTAAPDRPPLPKRPDVVAMMKDYKGGAAASAGEVFVGDPDVIDKRTARSTLPGGLKLALLPKKTKGSAVRLLLSIHYGDEKALTGKTVAARLLPEMLARGTKRHSFQQLKDELDKLRVELNLAEGRAIRGGPGVATLELKTVRETLPQVLSLFTEMLREPAFSKSELEALRKEHLARLEEQLQDPAANSFRTLTQRVAPWPEGDVRRALSIKEEIEKLRKVQASELVSLHKSLWGSGAAQLAIVGDFDEAQARGIIEKELGAWKAPRPYERIARPYKEGKAGVDVINTPDKEMAFLAVGHPLEVRNDDPDYPALVMVNQLLGGSASSRILNRLRQKEGISYGAFSDLQADAIDRRGVFMAGAMCTPKNADKAMAALMDELDKFIKDGITDKELAEAKASYAQSWANRVADDDFVAGELAYGLYVGRTFGYWKDLNAKIQKLTRAEVEAAARKYLQPAKLAKVRAGDFQGKKS